jgi:FkbM family methyltransferase
MIKTVKTKYSDNFSFYLNDNVIGKSLDLYGEYASNELEFLTSILNKNCVVWDIGSNIGIHAVAFASKANYVFCFEPNQHNLRLLLKNTEHLENITVINAAVSDRNNTVLFQDFDPSKEGNFGSVKIGKGNRIGLSIKLDDWNFPKPDLIKLDVETFEWPAMQGMDNTIRKYLPAIYFEAHETPDLPEIYDYLTSIGYSLYWCEVPNFNPNNLNNHPTDIFCNSGTYSLFCVPSGLEHNFSMPKMSDRFDSAEKLIERNRPKE